jgi:FtsP/CotA-like multicopper oxidase with cupredoxin domain
MVAIEMPVSEETPKVETVERPTIHSFNTARVKISKGQSATLSWHVSHSDRIRIEPDIGSVSALGSKNIKPSKTTTYTLTATNRGGETVETCKVEVR